MLHSQSHRESTPRTPLLQRVYFATLLGNALAAYTIAGIPIPWLSQLLAFGAAIVLLIKGRLVVAPGTSALLAFIAWAIVASAWAVLTSSHPTNMPAQATTGYSMFIGLRVFTLLSFWATLAITYTLLRRGQWDGVLRATINLGVFASVCAIYMYLAQTYGLPEPPRNRMGTGGESINVTFTYAFHRALGTFREPSHLAEWLLVPFFLCFIPRPRISLVSGLLIGSALLLTGSLTGILGAAVGLLFAPFMAGRVSLKSLLPAIRIAAITIAAMVVFNLVAVGADADQFSLVTVVAERVEPILASGGSMEETNRAYVFDYMARAPLSIFGSGLGNANIRFAEHLGIPVVASFISLYFNTYMAAGLIGVVLLGMFLARPLITLRQQRSQGDIAINTMIAGGYIAWLVAFAAHAEEMTMMFGVVSALALYRRTNSAPAPAQPQVRPWHASAHVSLGVIAPSHDPQIR